MPLVLCRRLIVFGSSFQLQTCKICNRHQTKDYVLYYICESDLVITGRGIASTVLTATAWR